MFGNALKSYRLANGLTVGQLAALLGVGKGTVSKWENGVTPREAQRQLIVEKLGLRITIEPASPEAA